MTSIASSSARRSLALLAWLAQSAALPAALSAALSACCESSAAGTPDAGPPAPSVQIGMRRGARDNSFVLLEPGADIRLGTFGQGGTHAELAVRCIGFGNRAFVTLTLENLRDGTVIMHPPTSRPQLLRCVEDPPGACDLLPIYFMTGGLAVPAEKDGLPVLARASCLNEAGDQATVATEGVLRADQEAAGVGQARDGGAAGAGDGGSGDAGDDDAGS